MFHAYCFGIDRYRDVRIPNLRCAAAGARAVAAILCAHVPLAELDARVWVDADATRAQIRQLLGSELPRKAGPDDTALIFFAGHGEMHRRRDRAACGLAVHDSAYWDRATHIDLQRDLLRWVSRSRARLTLLILDACAAGWIAPRAPPLLSRAAEPAPAPGAGRLIFTANQGSNDVLEPEANRHTVFSRNLLTALDRGLARRASAIEIFEGAARAIERETSGAQIPTIAGFCVGASPLVR